MCKNKLENKLWENDEFFFFFLDERENDELKEKKR